MNAEEMIALAEKMSKEYSDGRFQRKTDKGGAYRAVIVEGGYAFKAVHNVNCVDYNRAEWHFYAMANDTVRAYFVKPVYLSRNGNVIVMECVTTWRERPNRLDRDAWYEQTPDDVARSLNDTLRASYGFAIGDLHGGNWGIRKDGTIIVIDYGELLHEAKRRDPDKQCTYSPEAMGVVCKLLSY